MGERRAVSRGPIAGVIGVEIAAAIVLTIISGVVAAGGATDHARLHAISALVVLLIAGAILFRWPAAGLASRAPAVGLGLFAVGQLLEGAGALGFAADNDTRRNDLAVLHDLGLAATAFGLVAVAIGLAVGIGVGLGRRPGPRRWVGVAVALGFLGAGLLMVKTLIGF